jgi:enamine deaminase RidA (YjgF/YER057c/UK114 family)
MRRFLRTTVLYILVLASLSAGKKKKEEITQVLDLPPEPPAATTAETKKLVFHVTSLSGKGLLSAQTRDAIRALLRDSSGEQIVKIRAFVAGSGDVRRIPQIVGELIAEKKRMQLPAVSVVQAGGLPMTDAQVVLEAVAVTKKEVNPNGLIFLSAREAAVNQPLQPVLPLAEKALAQVRAELGGRGEVVRLTCFATALDSAPQIQSQMASHFPGAVINLVQTQRAPTRTSVACEAVARANSAAGGVHAERLVFTGTQVAYGFAEDDARLAMRRLDRTLNGAGSSLKQLVMLQAYPLSYSIAAQIDRIAPEFYDAGHPPAMAVLPFEGLPGIDASFAVDAIAIAR